MRVDSVHKITPESSTGLSEDAKALVNFMVKAHEVARDVLGEEAPMEYNQWLVLSRLLENQALGHPTTVKDVHDIVKKLQQKTALNTVRTRFEKLQKKEYIAPARKVARTLLYHPTERLFSALNLLGAKLQDEPRP